MAVPQRSDQSSILGEFGPIVILAIAIGAWLIVSIATPVVDIYKVKFAYIETKIYGTITFWKIDAFKEDIQQLERAKIYAETSKWKNIDRDYLKYVVANYNRSAYITKSIIIILFIMCLVFLFKKEQKEKKMAFCNPTIVPPKKGVEGFIEIIKGYVSEDLLEDVRKNPTPEKLFEVYNIARRKGNIPPNWVARCFDRFSEERLRLLEWGKNAGYDREFISIVRKINNRDKSALDEMIRYIYRHKSDRWDKNKE